MDEDNPYKMSISKSGSGMSTGFPQSDFTDTENRIISHMRQYSGKSELIERHLEEVWLNRLCGDQTTITKTSYKDGIISVQHIPNEDYYEFWDESFHIGPKTQKAVYDLLQKDLSDLMETPVSSPPKLTQAQRAKLKAKRKLNRQNRKRARK